MWCYLYFLYMKDDRLSTVDNNGLEALESLSFILFARLRFFTIEVNQFFFFLRSFPFVCNLCGFEHLSYMYMRDCINHIISSFEIVCKPQNLFLKRVLIYCVRSSPITKLY